MMGLGLISNIVNLGADLLSNSVDSCTASTLAILMDGAKDELMDALVGDLVGDPAGNIVKDVLVGIIGYFYSFY